MEGNTKFCQHCGQTIAKDAVICPQCGRQVQEIASAQAVPANIVINNTNTNANVNTNINAGAGMARARSKWVALAFCFFLGYLGAHKFYEGKTAMGIVYLFTFGLLGIGIFIDFFVLLLKPNPYYV